MDRPRTQSQYGSCLAPYESEAVRSLWTQLVRGMEPSSVLDNLFSFRIISLQTQQELHLPCLTKSERNRKLLESVLTSDEPEAFRILVESLAENHVHLADMLNSEAAKRKRRHCMKRTSAVVEEEMGDPLDEEGDDLCAVEQTMADFNVPMQVSEAYIPSETTVEKEILVSTDPTDSEDDFDLNLTLNPPSVQPPVPINDPVENSEPFTRPSGLTADGQVWRDEKEGLECCLQCHSKVIDRNDSMEVGGNPMCTCGNKLRFRLRSSSEKRNVDIKREKSPRVLRKTRIGSSNDAIQHYKGSLLVPTAGLNSGAASCESVGAQDNHPSDASGASSVSSKHLKHHQPVVMRRSPPSPSDHSCSPQASNHATCTSTSERNFGRHICPSVCARQVILTRSSLGDSFGFNFASGTGRPRYHGDKDFYISTIHKNTPADLMRVRGQIRENDTIYTVDGRIAIDFRLDDLATFMNKQTTLTLDIVRFCQYQQVWHV